MDNLVLIIVCLFAGSLLRRFHAFPKNSPQVLNAFVIYLSFPALVLIQIPKLVTETEISSALVIPVSMAWLQFAIAAAVVVSLGRVFSWSRATTGALVLTAGLGNTSFVGFPLLEALLGPGAIRTAIIVDQAGSFLVLSTLGIVCASLYSGQGVSPKTIVRKIVLFPPFLALVAAFLSVLVKPDFFAPVEGSLERLGATLTPLALVSVGFQLQVNPALLRRRFVPLSFGLGIKLLLVPALLWLLYVGAIGSRSIETKITLLESAMAPMITGAIVASDFHLDSELASLMVGIGVPLSLLTVMTWHWLI